MGRVVVLTLMVSAAAGAGRRGSRGWSRRDGDGSAGGKTVGPR